ncbi:MAG: hypothetical protein QW734_06515 [Candidatus Bathyarchaeia archaeon]
MERFEAIVREQPSPFGKIGKITSKHLGKYIGKKVIIKVEKVVK